MLRVCLQVSVLIVSAFAAALFASSALQLLPTARVVDPIEHAILDHSVPLPHYAAMYTEPATPSEPSLLPGFPLLISVAAGELEPQLWQVRALGLAAVLFVAFLIGVIVQLETGSWTLALASVSFALLGQGFLAASAGIARPEILMMALVLLGFLILRHTQGIWGALLAAVPLGAAVFVEPQAGWFAAAALTALAIEDSRRVVAFKILAGLVIAGGYVASSRYLGPWFNFNAWDEPVRHLQFNAVGILRFVGNHLLGNLGVWTCAGLLSFAMSAQPWNGKGGIWTWMAAAAVVGGLVATQSTAFGPHALLPSIIVLSLLGPIMMQRVARYLAAWKDPDRPGGEGVVFAAVLLQFVALFAAVPLERWVPSVMGLVSWGS